MQAESSGSKKLNIGISLRAAAEIAHRGVAGASCGRRGSTGTKEGGKSSGKQSAVGRLLFKQRVIFIFNSMDGKQPPHRLKFAQKMSRIATSRFGLGINELRLQSSRTINTGYLAVLACVSENQDSVKNALANRSVL